MLRVSWKSNVNVVKVLQCHAELLQCATLHDKKMLAMEGRFQCGSMVVLFVAGLQLPM